MSFYEYESDSTEEDYYGDHCAVDDAEEVMKEGYESDDPDCGIREYWDALCKAGLIDDPETYEQRAVEDDDEWGGTTRVKVITRPENDTCSELFFPKEVLSWQLEKLALEEREQEGELTDEDAARLRVLREEITETIAKGEKEVMQKKVTKEDKDTLARVSECRNRYYKLLTAGGDRDELMRAEGELRALEEREKEVLAMLEYAHGISKTGLTKNQTKERNKRSQAEMVSYVQDCLRKAGKEAVLYVVDFEGSEINESVDLADKGEVDGEKKVKKEVAVSSERVCVPFEVAIERVVVGEDTHQHIFHALIDAGTVPPTWMLRDSVYSVGYAIFKMLRYSMVHVHGIFPDYFPSNNPARVAGARDDYGELWKEICEFTKDNSIPGVFFSKGETSLDPRCLAWLRYQAAKKLGEDELGPPITAVDIETVLFPAMGKQKPPQAASGGENKEVAKVFNPAEWRMTPPNELPYRLKKKELQMVVPHGFEVVVGEESLTLTCAKPWDEVTGEDLKRCTQLITNSYDYTPLTCSFHAAAEEPFQWLNGDDPIHCALRDTRGLAQVVRHAMQWANL